MKKRKFLRLTLLLLSIIFLLSAGAILISAESSQYNDNLSKYENERNILHAEQSKYIQKSNESDSIPIRAAISVNTIISTYETKMRNALDDRANENIDLSKTFATYREQAIHVGQLAWIVFAHSERALYDLYEEDLDEEALVRDTVYAEFLKYKEDIDDAATESAAKAKKNDNCKALLKFVFNDNLDILRNAGTEEYGIKQRINTDEIRINALEAYDIDAVDYYDIYNETLLFVTVRRAYSIADKELKQVVSALGANSDSQPVKDFATVLDTLRSIDDVNNALGNATAALIEIRIPESTGFIGKFKNDLLRDCSDKVTEACDKEVDEFGNTIIADLSAVFENIDLREYCARKKDDVDSLVPQLDRDSAQRNIIRSYTDKGGILDKCTDRTSIDFEVQRAKIRIQLYNNYIANYRSIETDLENVGNTTLLQNATSIYTAADAKIVDINRDLSDAQTQCNMIYEKAAADLDDLAHQAKALKYLYKHRNILNEKTSDTITSADRGALEAAIAEYTALEPQTQKYLNDAKKDINAKYKALSVIEIKNSADPKSNDTQALVNSTNNLSADLAPANLKKLADDNVLRGTALGTLQKKYNDIKSDRDFNSYDDDTKKAILSDYTIASQKILDSAAASDRSLSDVLANINAQAALNMEKHDAIGKVNLAAKDCDLDDVRATVAQAKADILADESTADVHKTRDAAIFRINCQKKASEMRKTISALKAKIDTLSALNNADKATLKSEADALISDCNAAANAKDQATLDKIVSDFTDKLSELESKVEKENLLEGKRQAIEAIKNAANSAEKKIDGYVFINYENKDTANTLKSLLNIIISDFETAVNNGSVGWNELNSMKSEALTEIGKVLADADAAEKSGAKASSKDSINGTLNNPEHYSDNNKAKIEDIINGAISDLNKADSVNEIIAIRDEALDKIASILDLLGEAKRDSLDKLEQVYNSLKEDMHCYSDTVWTEIQEIYDHTVAEIGMLSKFEERSKADSIAEERCALIRAKKRDRVYSNDGLLESGATSYPNNYDVIRNGYAASLIANGQVPYNATFSIFPFSDPNAQALIRKAVKDMRVILPDGKDYDDSVIRTLRGCKILAGLDIAYSASAVGVNGTYTVTLILPNDFNTEDLLGAVYIRSDGSIEFFEASVSDNTVTFDVPHFSSFYLVSEKTVNLMPLIIILSILLLAEAAAITFFVLRHINRIKAATVASVIPVLPFTVLTKLIPAGALPISIILGALVLCAGGAIAWFVVNELKNKAPDNKKEIKETRSEEISEPVQKSDPVQETDPIPVPAIIEPKHAPVLDTVSVDEANDLMSDSDALAAIESVSADDLPPTVYSSHGKKYEVNIDVISNAFSADETVSLDSLKEKGLVPKGAKAVKILARGSLDKPLTVIAQDFSSAAVKMITLTGGHALLVERE